MDTRVLDFQAKAAAVDWTNEQNVVNYLLEGAALMSGRKPFDKKRAEKVISAEFNRAYKYISMFNHAGLQGGEAFYNHLNEITQPALIIHGTEDLIWHFRHTKVMLEKIKNAELLILEGTGHELHREDWDTIINAIAAHAGKAAR